MSGFTLDPAYKGVPERLADLKAVHPDAVLRPQNPDEPFQILKVGEQFFVVYTAVCYRTPDDKLPAIATAWEPFPGKTPYTKDSELQNAETSAWGRAIVASLRSESKSIASAEDVRNRAEDASSTATAPTGTPGEVVKPLPLAEKNAFKARIAKLDDKTKTDLYATWSQEGLPDLSHLVRLDTKDAIEALISRFEQQAKEAAA